MDKVVGRIFRTDIACELVDTADWKITVTIVEKRLIGGKDWEEKEVATSCTDNDFDHAYEVAMIATMNKFNDLLEETKGNGMFPRLVEDSAEEE